MPWARGCHAKQRLPGTRNRRGHGAQGDRPSSTRRVSRDRPPPPPGFPAAPGATGPRSQLPWSDLPTVGPRARCALDTESRWLWDSCGATASGTGKGNGGVIPRAAWGSLPGNKQDLALQPQARGAEPSGSPHAPETSQEPAWWTGSLRAGVTGQGHGGGAAGRHGPHGARRAGSPPPDHPVPRPFGWECPRTFHIETNSVYKCSSPGTIRLPQIY